MRKSAKETKVSFWVIGNSADIRTGHLQNTTLQLYRYTISVLLSWHSCNLCNIFEGTRIEPYTSTDHPEWAEIYFNYADNNGFVSSMQVRVKHDYLTQPGP
jgi:hypothetical protein